jgi:hypothetical protein
MTRLTYKSTALTLAAFLAVGYVVCVVYCLLVPTSWQMYPLWDRLLPGFTWLSWGSFLLGLVEVVVYGLYIALLVPIYRLFAGAPEASAG